jgi:hemin uptake protein HemP
MSIEVKNELALIGSGWDRCGLLPGDGGAWRDLMMVELEKKDAGKGQVSLPAEAVLPEYDTQELFAGRREIVIRHAGADYRMKITKQGKLILNK